MVAFHGKQEVKDFYLNRVREHRAMGQLRQGFGYWNGDTDGTFRGCAVGCTLHSSDHAAYETELGIPKVLGRLEDGIFEGLLNQRAKSWPEEFLNAAQPGADLSLVWPQFAVWLMVDDEWGVINFAKNDRSRDAIRKVGDLYRRKVAGDEIGSVKFPAADAAAAAYAAAAPAYAPADAYAAADAAVAVAPADAYADDAYAPADAYASAAAADAADAYTYTYTSPAAAAVVAAYAAAAVAAVYREKYYSTRQMARAAQADKLLELMAAAPVMVAA